MDALKIKQIFWETEYQIPNTNWRIKGYSRSAFRTGFYIPELDLMLDAGPQNFSQPKHIFITHTHGDHIANLPFTLIEGDNEKNIEIYAHYKADKFIDNYVNAMFSLNIMDNIDTINGYKFNGLKPNDVFRTVCNKTNLQVEVFECDHSIRTISFGFGEIKRKLKDEYTELQGKEIAKLRKEGVDITKEVIQKKLAYVCDTTIDVFKMNLTVLEYKVIFIECTFILDDELESAKEKSHIHWQHLKPYVVENSDKIFVLFHFSQRYRDSEIGEFFQKEVDNGITNIHWWVTNNSRPVSK